MNEKCFALKNKGRCRALTNETCCGFDSCPFYKGKTQAAQDEEKANERLRALPREEQSYIAGKYYGGAMPWARGVV